MASLTERRFTKAKPILDQYRDQLHTSGRISTSDLEHELRECWNIGYQELKGIVLDLSKRDHYRYLAAYYMEDGHGVGVVTEFKGRLAELYGIESYDNCPNREEKREAFWKTMIADQR